MNNNTFKIIKKEKGFWNGNNSELKYHNIFRNSILYSQKWYY